MSVRGEQFFLDTTRANQIRPRARPRYTLTPSIVFKGDHPMISFSTAATAAAAHQGLVVAKRRASASERSQRTFITMKVRSSYCSASRIQSFISSESRALMSLAGR
jgi:hypothetical protein